MPIPAPNFSPPFTIVRCSHVDLTVRDLAASRAFYERTLGLNVTDETGGALYLRGMEERNHHSIVCRQGAEPACNRLGFKVASEEDLDRAAAWFDAKGMSYDWADKEFQGRTLHVEDPRGMPLEFYFKMNQAPRLLAEIRPLPFRPADAHRPLQLFLRRRPVVDRLLQRARLPHHRIHRHRRAGRAALGDLDAPQGHGP